MMMALNFTSLNFFLVSQKAQNISKYSLVGGFNPSEKY